MNATDRAALRDRIADTLSAADGWSWAPGFDKTMSPSYQGYIRQADAVLAIWPGTCALPESQRQFLNFALDQAAVVMYDRDGFTDEDWRTLEKLRARVNDE